MKLYGSAKLSKELLNQIIEDKGFTSKQLDVFLWLVRRQDAAGLVEGVKYREVCGDTTISHQEFYDCIYRLERQKYIVIKERNSSEGWEIFIFSNKFLSRENDKQGYIDINRSFLYRPLFQGLRANEKKLVLKIISVFGKGAFFLTAKTVEKWLDIHNIQLIRSYVNKIKRLPVFSVAQTNTKDLYAIHKVLQYLEEKGESNVNYSMKQRLKTLCRRHKVTYDDEAIEHLTVLIKQYRKYGALIETAIHESIETLKQIQPAHVNYLFQKLNPGR